MNIEKTINNIVDRILNEELTKKVTKATKTVKEEMGKAPENRSEEGNSEVLGVYSNIENQRKEQEETMCEECGMTEELCECGMSEGEMEEGAKPDFLDLDNDGDKKEPMKKAAKDAKNESKKKTISLSESEMIELIQRLVIEEKEAKGTKETNKVLKDSKKVNDEAMEAVNKKMNDYVKSGSNEGYKEDPETFPKGNGEMGEDDKMMYHASDAVEEYIDQIARSGGMENLDYDAIKPDEDWIEMNILGDSKTGNSQEYANAVKTDANEKVNQRRKKNWLAKLKKDSYQKAVQPVEDIAGRKKGKQPIKSPEELMTSLSESTDKKDMKINEDIQKMKSMLSYSRKTQ